MKHASARIATAAFSAVVFGLAIGALPVYADANPNNEGHHYGQIKHPKHPPVPIPSPTPVPSSFPTTNPLNTNVPAVKAVVAPASQPGATSSEPVTGLNPIVGPQAGRLRTAPKQPAPTDPLWWLVLVILPALMAIWLIAFKRVTGRPSREGRAQESRPQAAAPELVASPQV